MNTLFKAATTVTALTLTLISGTNDARAAVCHSHPKAGLVCSDSPAYQALNLPRVNGKPKVNGK